MRGGRLEPAFAANDVGGDKFVIGFREIKNSLDKANDATEAAGDNGRNKLDDSFLSITEIEFVDAQASE